MREISKKTRSEILDFLVQSVASNCEYRDPKRDESVCAYIPFYGRLTLDEFLKRLYPSFSLESKKEGDLYFVHAPLRNILNDDRLMLKEGNNDEPLLNFLCEMFNPEVRDETTMWSFPLEKINDILRKDGYEIIESTKSKLFETKRVTPVTTITSKKDLFSERYKNYLRTNDNFEQFLPNDYRQKIVTIIGAYNEIRTGKDYQDIIYFKNDKTDLLYFIVEQLDELLKFKLSEPYRQQGEQRNTEEIALYDYPLKYIFDIIELQYRRLRSESRKTYRDHLNEQFEAIYFPFTLSKTGLFEVRIYFEGNNYNYDSLPEIIRDSRIGSLVDDAIDLIKEPDEASHQKALQKLWEAFVKIREKIVDNDKLIESITNGDECIILTISNEIDALTLIGVKYHIDEENNSLDIYMCDYLFNRYLSFVVFILQNKGLDILLK